VRMPLLASIALLTIISVVGSARPAAADTTVISHYTLVDGDTLTRASYYTSRRVRVTGPDGKEYIFDQKTDSITVIDHLTKVYWTGPRSFADSVASKIMVSNRKGIPEIAKTDPVAWSERIQAFNDSIHVEATQKQMDFAGVPCDQWILTAGSQLRTELWIARSLVVQNYGPELQKVVLASIRDPLGRALMRLQIAMRTKEGLPLAGMTNFRTYSSSGSFQYAAMRVSDKKIPASAWSVPAGYAQLHL
jgi:hypothetical protein